MRHLFEFAEFEPSIDIDEVNLIEDCFLDFCATYKQDITVDVGYMVYGNFITSGLLPDLIKMSKEFNKKLHIKEV